MSIIPGQPLVEVPALTIAEQTGDQRTLVLTERALPYRPIEFGSTQVAEFTRYPGNPIRTLQVLGPEEEPFECAGFWKDRFLGETNALSRTSMAYYTQNGQTVQLLTAMDLVALCNDMLLKGQEVVVQWGPEVRRGIMRRFSRRWHNVHDAEWSMKFEWTSQNLPEVPATIAKDTDYANVQGTLQSYSNAIQQLIDEAEDVAAQRLEQFNSMAATMTGLVEQFQDTTANALDTTMPIMDQQRRLAGILGSIGSSADDFTDLITSAPAATFATLPTPAITIDGATLAGDWLSRQLMAKLRDMKYAALRAQYDIAKSVNPDPVTVFTARQDTDLRDVSTKYYGRPDDWRSIAVYNELQGSGLESGDAVFVPKLLRSLDGSS